MLVKPGIAGRFNLRHLGKVPFSRSFSKSELVTPIVRDVLRIVRRDSLPPLKILDIAQSADRKLYTEARCSRSL